MAWDSIPNGCPSEQSISILQGADRPKPDEKVSTNPWMTLEMTSSDFPLLSGSYSSIMAEGPLSKSVQNSFFVPSVFVVYRPHYHISFFIIDKKLRSVRKI